MVWPATPGQSIKESCCRIRVSMHDPDERIDLGLGQSWGQLCRVGR
jgi:hypothetical protein